MVGVRQVVVDGFGHTDDAQVVASIKGLLVDFVRRVLGIVSAQVKEVADFVRPKNLEEPVHVPRGPFRFFLQIDFVAGGAQRGGGSVFQPFYGGPFLLLQIDQFLVENS